MTWVLAFASMGGTVLNVRKQRASFAIWFFTNTAWSAYDFAHGLPAQGCLMATYACLAVWGFSAWRKRDA